MEARAVTLKTVTEYRYRQRYQSPDGQAALTLEEGDHGLWRFTVWKWVETQGDHSEFEHAYWLPSFQSGLYAAVAEATAAARTQVDWFRPQVR